MRRFGVVLLLVAVMFVPLRAVAQELASLVADSITVDPAGRVTATGNVEVFFGGTRMRAGQVSYSRNGDRLTILGPIRITDADGTILLADQAAMDRDLQNGVLISARMVLDQQLQIAAQEIARVNDRYTRLDRVVASSCEICAANPTPLWEIRASRVIHDELERQLYFEGAQFRVVGLPVFYFPRLRVPDPSVERTSGFLIPRFTSSSDLGSGVKLPYFITLGEHADVTLTPYVTSSTATLQFSYRHQFRKGSLAAQGAVSSDDIDNGRAFLFAYGDYQLPRGFQATAQLEFVSDPGYLFTYDFGDDKDRLTNQVEVTRVRKKDLFRGSISEYRTLRETEIPIRDTLPDQFIELTYQREVPELSFGGRTFLTVGGASLRRPSSANIEGRDVSRISAELDWRQQGLAAPGFVWSSELGARIDAYSVGQDTNFASSFTRIVPRGAVELRYPMSRRTDDGGVEVFEPVFRVDYSDAGGNDAPLEDSRIVEFDEANLFSPSRYPGVDGVEDNVRVALGAAWKRRDPRGWTLDVTVGRVANLSGDLGFGEGSGLEGDRSEWLLHGRFVHGSNIHFVSRSLFDEDINFTLSENRLDWSGEDFSFGTSYLYAVPEPSEDRDAQLSEWSFRGSYDLGDAWTANAGWRYDLNAKKATRSSLGLGYQTECVDLSLSLSRRFATSTSVDPTTEFGFRVSLTGVGGRTASNPTGRRCRG